MFLIRVAFWLTLLLLILPIDRDAAGIDAGPGAFEQLAALQTTVNDLRGFCSRNPDACATGAATADALRQRAVHAAGQVHAWLSQEGGEDVLAASAVQPPPGGPSEQPMPRSDPLGELIAQRSAHSPL
ncbi:MAG: DUF5330 domain-containing protein [Pseudomonadota bacterium]